jgi:hypothetical protein
MLEFLLKYTSHLTKDMSYAIIAFTQCNANYQTSVFIKSKI